jgi:hypothetical protein
MFRTLLARASAVVAVVTMAAPVFGVPVAAAAASPQSYGRPYRPAVLQYANPKLCAPAHENLRRLGTAPLLIPPSTSGAQLASNVLAHEAIVHRGAQAIGLTEPQWQRVRRLVGRSAPWVTIPRCYDSFTWATSPVNGVVHVDHNVRIPANEKGFSFSWTEGKTLITVVIPAKCGNIAVVKYLAPEPPRECPPGTSGTYPDCPKPKCPPGMTGTPPNCTPPACPPGMTGTPPNCTPPVCPPGMTGTPPNCTPPVCPPGMTGTPPNCTPPVCPTGMTGTPPNCVPIPCPPGTTGTPPACITPPPPSPKPMWYLTALTLLPFIVHNGGGNSSPPGGGTIVGPPLCP